MHGSGGPASRVVVAPTAAAAAAQASRSAETTTSAAASLTLPAVEDDAVVQWDQWGVVMAEACTLGTRHGRGWRVLNCLLASSGIPEFPPGVRAIVLSKQLLK